MMDDQAKAEYELQSLQVRAELKKWETDWAAEHGGNKPSRDDIKQNPDIAKKYKQYNKLRDVLSGKIPPQELSKPSKSKSSTHRPPQTPSKHAKTAQTPRKQHFALPNAQTPSARTPGAATPLTARKLFSPALPTSIGPTPQKDGRVLGLFDLLGKTPSKPTESPFVKPAGATPSKRRASEIGDLTTPSAKRIAHDASTPNTGTKLFGAATTPLHERPGNTGGRRGSFTTTPSSTRTSKLFSTPAFLRRTTALPPVDETDENGEWKVGPLRLPRVLNRKGVKVKGLSEVVAGLRKIEDDAHEDEEDALREMEAEELGIPVTKPAVSRLATVPEGVEVEVGDSQAALPPPPPPPPPPPQPKQKPEKPVLLSHFDDESLYDSGNEDLSKEGVDQHGNPLRVFKKRGQKRTTRLVKMKPTRSRRPGTISTTPPDHDDPSQRSEGEDAVIPETQYGNNTSQRPPPGGDDLLLSGSDFNDDDGEDNDDDDDDDFDTLKPTPKSSSASAGGTKKTLAETKKGGASKKEEEKKEGTVKKAMRKVKATAHANFKRLKLKQGGAKGGPGYNSRFRRRR
ncbi:DNA replication/checkpoint protein [Apiosordaria backusii]|uniref:DNA replication regulator SLD2 n=1 Tax=Apiosordaria backusii TaxID=314023 RepID=A0AA40E3T3_9PEZI|nr:DNA replication/checkpoint protein [Apiosordaria backusii]